MRFVLHIDVLNGSDEALSLVDRLVDRIADEVHRIDVPDVDFLQDSEWFKGARPTRRSVLTSAVSRPPRQANPNGLHTRTVEVRNLDDARVADRLAHSPLEILVEDREADGVLLDMLVEELGSPDLQSLWAIGQAVTPRALLISNSGGINAMPQRVERAVSDANNEGRPVRLFVLCDSDARWPNDIGNQSQRSIDALRGICGNSQISLHVLVKRNAENYIPDTVIEDVRDDPRNTNNRDRFDLLLGLTPDQRDHFPVKDGLSTREREEAIAAGLYEAAQEPELKNLEERLFPKRPRPLLLLQRERRAKFSAAGFRARDGNGEVDTLLEALAREL